MKQLSKMLPLLVSGTFLMVGAVSADPDRGSDRDRILAQNSRECSNNHNCRPSGPKADRHDQDNDRNQGSNIADNRRNDGDRDRDNRQSWDRDRNNWQSQWDRDHYRNRTRIEFRLSTYPIYVDSRHRTRFVHRSPLYWGPIYRYPHGYYYRESRFPTYPDRAYDYAPDNTRIIWNDNTQPTTQTTDEYCREYYTDAGVNGQTQQVYGTACMQPDGSWQIKN